MTGPMAGENGGVESRAESRLTGPCTQSRATKCVCGLTPWVYLVGTVAAW